MTESNQDASWQWKVGRPSDNARLRMLYEPGNWGDVVKGVWTVAAARVVAQAITGRGVRYLDPFAGAPTYPLTEGAAQRISGVAQSGLARAAEVFTEKREWPSAALLFRASCEAVGTTAELRVFDLDETRRAAWMAVRDVTICSQVGGVEILSAAQTEDPAPDFVLVDPYDFLADWKAFLSPILERAQHSVVLTYIYNRAPRSVGHLNLYKRFRAELDRLRSGKPFLLGRLACDEMLPRAYHEMLLMGPPSILDALRDPLCEQTKALVRRLAETRAFEVGQVF